MPDPVESEILGTRVQSTPLLFKVAQPLVPQILEIISIASRDVVPLFAAGKVNPKADLADPVLLATVLPSLGNLARHLDEGGRLDRLAPKILSTTRVVVGGEWFDLVKPSDWEHVFGERPDLFLPVLLFAGRVTFGRFFPATGPRAGVKTTA